MSGRIQDDPRRVAFAAGKNAPQRWAAMVQAPFSNLSCAQFQAQAATWTLVKQAAVANAAGKSQVVRAAVNRMIADIESWPANANCRYIIFDHAGHRGVAVVMVNGFEMPTLRYCLSDGSDRGIGKCLIEETVNVSARGDKDGKVCLIAESTFLEGLYAHYGFKIIYPANMMSGAVMALDPKGERGNTMWFYTGQRWCFCPV